ncbi:nuclear transport factor 2 family protein [Dyadobacter pollutisoli]|uniref:Nuclear transport factor 2 family protein n=1 Tax=Dyadobacter pollutisoli TaxID=2910158 RepID=A0A9E8SK86_9BACT|nr:nuclear transport factor 2 family protein [Dyadobacter pollutisoli]WAC10501.1 nuclear transport factor 2 family protein [Dyadobacter pollutisoli]
MSALETVKQYYQSFNQQNWDGMLVLLHTEIRHEANQGDVRIGIEKFAEFLAKMDESYQETLSDMVFFSEPTDSRVAVEFVVNGIYKKGEEGLPEAYGQSYALPAAAFLELKEGKISRVTTYYNLPLWIELVSKPKND